MDIQFHASHVNTLKVLRGAGRAGVKNMDKIADVVNAYLGKGFGSMNNNDFEVWIFH
ncbi:MAG: hypothetical protein IJ762_05405 [Bacteroidaceae bacterium]|nr:hypothetical protein [Bacteroidaceae bacterium]